MNLLIETILEDCNLDGFFELLWKDKNVGKIFFLHKSDLFPIEFNTNIDVLIYQSDNEILDITDFSLNRYQYNKIQEDDQTAKLLTLKTFIFSEYLPIFLKILFEFLKDIEPLRKYFQDEIDVNELVGRTKATLKKFINEGSISSSSQTTSEDEMGIYTKIYKGFNKEKFTMGNLASSNLKIGFIYLYRFLFSNPNFPFNIYELLGISENDYNDVLRKLQNLDLINSQFTYSICQLCKYNEFQYFVSLSDMDIGNLSSSKIICPQCGEITTIRSLLFLHPLLSKIIIYFPDGLLSVAIAWYLEKNGMKWVHSTYGEGKREKDFIISTPKNNKILIESKVIKRKEDENSLGNVFKKAIEQIQNQLNEINNEEERIDYILIVFNLNLKSYRKLIKKILNESQISNLDVIGYDKLQSKLCKF